MLRYTYLPFALGLITIKYFRCMSSHRHIYYCKNHSLKIWLFHRWRLGKFRSSLHTMTTEARCHITGNRRTTASEHTVATVIILSALISLVWELDIFLLLNLLFLKYMNSFINVISFNIPKCIIIEEKNGSKRRKESWGLRIPLIQPIETLGSNTAMTAYINY